MLPLDELKSQKRKLVFGVLLFDDHSLLDAYGPYELFASINYKTPGTLDIVTIGVSTAKRVTPYQGPVTLTDLNLKDDDIPKLDLLLIPGGPGVDALLAKTDNASKLEKVVAETTLVCTVAKGSQLLAAWCPSIMNEKSATTIKSELPRAQSLYPNVKWQTTTERWIVDGKLYTAGGVSAGIDMVQWAILGELYGEKVGLRIGDMTEYKGNPDATNDKFVGASIPNQTDKKKKTISVGLVLYDMYELWDTYGPLEMFSTANRLLGGNAFTLTSFAEFKQVTASGGPAFEASKLFDELTGDDAFDVLLIPGGIGTLREVYNTARLHTFLQKIVPKSKLVMTVCSGSTILASAGILNKRRATSNKLLFDMLALYGPSVQWVEKARWVVDGKFYTSSGVAAGTDLSLFVLQDLFDVQFARAVATAVEYEWNEDSGNDPFVSTIPAPTIVRKGFIMFQKLVVGLIFNIGMLLGYPMTSITPAMLGMAPAIVPSN